MDGLFAFESGFFFGKLLKCKKSGGKSPVNNFEGKNVSSHSGIENPWIVENRLP